MDVDEQQQAVSEETKGPLGEGVIDVGGAIRPDPA